MSEGAVIVYVPDGSYHAATVDPHVTLGFFGKASDLEPWQKTVMMNIASDLAEMKPHYVRKPKVTGRGVFNIDPAMNDGNTYAYFDLIDWNAFPKARAEVEDRAGFVNRGHGFIPHMTIAYGNSWIPDLAEPVGMYQFDWASVDVWFGDERISYPIN